MLNTMLDSITGESGQGMECLLVKWGAGMKSPLARKSKGYKRFSELVDEIQSQRVNASAKVLLVTMASVERDTGYICVSHATLAERSGLPVATVRSAIAELITSNLIKLESRGGTSAAGPVAARYTLLAGRRVTTKTKITGPGLQLARITGHSAAAWSRVQVDREGVIAVGALHSINAEAMREHWTDADKTRYAFLMRIASPKHLLREDYLQQIFEFIEKPATLLPKWREVSTSRGTFYVLADFLE